MAKRTKRPKLTELPPGYPPLDPKADMTLDEWVDYIDLGREIGEELAKRNEEVAQARRNNPQWEDDSDIPF